MIVGRKTNFSLVMPVGPGSEKTIKKAIESILDQDCEDWELICVLNGKWKKDGVHKLVKRIADSRICVIDIGDVGNVCTARNKGAEVANGKYISFFSSDFYMFPGALNKWKDAFDEHPEVDFVYSGYRLMKDGDLQEAFVPSKPFDVWELEIMPYIDGGFPVKRECWEEVNWDPKIKSLNDWDWWIGIAHAGFKGYFMQDMTYAAEVPKAGGLSYDSSQNWLERVETIKKKHKIPIRDICVVSLGAAPHAKRIAKILDADFQVAPQGKPHNYKMIYLVGFYIGQGDSAMAHSQVFANAKDSIQVISWIGTDILQLTSVGWKVPYNELKVLIDSLNNRVNLAEFELSHNELDSMGVNSRIVPLPVEVNWDIMPLPDKFTVAVYAPKTATAEYIYNIKLMKDIAESCPQYDFIFFGGGIDSKAKNVTSYGWVPMEDVLEQSSCLLRLTYHDGMPVTPIEFKMAGREAITSVEMPYMFFGGSGIVHKENYAEKKEGIIKLLRDVNKKQKTAKYKREAKKAREFYIDLNSPKKFKKAVYDILKEKK